MMSHPDADFQKGGGAQKELNREAKHEKRELNSSK